MSRLGLGLLARPKSPPLMSNLLVWLDPDVGVTDTGGLVDAWASRVGAAVFTAAGAARPTRSAGYISFNGSTLLSRPSDAASHPAGVSRMTYAAWIYRSGSGFLVWYSGTNYAGAAAGGGYLQDYVGVARYPIPAGDTFETIAGDVALNTWIFRAWTFDGTQPAGSRIVAYEGATPATVAVVAGAESGAQTVTPAHIGNSYVGAGGAGSRNANGRKASCYIYQDAALSLSQLQDLAAFKVP